MNRISIRQAWSHATSFFNGQGVNHAIALIGVGIVVPLILQFTLGGSAQRPDPTAMARGGEAGMLAAFGARALRDGFFNFLVDRKSAGWGIRGTDRFTSDVGL